MPGWRKPGAGRTDPGILITPHRAVVLWQCCGWAGPWWPRAVWPSSLPLQCLWCTWLFCLPSISLTAFHTESFFQPARSSCTLQSPLWSPESFNAWACQHELSLSFVSKCPAFFVCNFLKNGQSKQQSSNISQGLNFLSGPGERGLFCFFSPAPFILYNPFPESQVLGAGQLVACLPFLSEHWQSLWWGGRLLGSYVLSAY